MELTIHSIERGIERGVDPYQIKDLINQHWNNIRYNLHTKSFYILSQYYLFVVKNKKAITLYSRTDERKMHLTSMKVPRHLKQKLKDYFFTDTEQTLSLFRECKKYNIELIEK